VSHPAFLLKDHESFTLAGMRVLAEQTTFGCMAVTGAGIFLNAAAEDRVKRDALNGATRPLELSFDDGRVVRGSFAIDAVHYAGTTHGERNYHIHLRSIGPVQ
jgi:predicted secreted protein